MMKNFKKYIKNPHRFFIPFALKGCFDKMPDEKYVKKMFRARVGYKLDLDNPKTFNEKLQWLKLYDHNPLYTKLVDKYLVREYIKEKIGEEYLIPLLGVWDRAEDIDFDKLPNEFVLKCNHNSGGLFICKDKRSLTEVDIKKVKEKLNGVLAKDYYLYSREWPYKDVPRKIIAEKYMVDESGYELKDYKFYCFNGEAKVMFIASGRGKTDEKLKIDFFDMEFNHLDLVINHHPNAARDFIKPDCFDKMRDLAETLAVGKAFSRIDFYNVNGRIYFGEITLFDLSGFNHFEPKEWDKKFGDWLVLPKKTKEVEQ